MALVSLQFGKDPILSTLGLCILYYFLSFVETKIQLVKQQQTTVSEGAKSIKIRSTNFVANKIKKNH